MAGVGAGVFASAAAGGSYKGLGCDGVESAIGDGGVVGHVVGCGDLGCWIAMD